MLHLEVSEARGLHAGIRRESAGLSGSTSPCCFPLQSTDDIDHEQQPTFLHFIRLQLAAVWEVRGGPAWKNMANKRRGGLVLVWNFFHLFILQQVHWRNFTFLCRLNQTVFFMKGNVLFFFLTLENK